MCSLDRIGRLIGPSAMPKRLIDLNPSDDCHSSPRIVNTMGRQQQYVALSYCWGPNKHLCTKKKNIRAMEEAIPQELLPQTIKDAFMVARHLDVRYVWVDALCIIQDDDKDWEIEAKRMGAIYANSYFTIAATNAEHSEEGFLKSRSPKRISIRLQYNTELEDRGEVYFRHRTDIYRDHDKYISSSPLLKRAWVLQETLLSRRTVHFSSKQIYWECRSAFLSEDGIENNPDFLERAHTFLNTLDGFSKEIHPNEMAQQIFFRVWSEVLQRYSTLDITRPSDKLPALSGLASLAEKNLGRQYLYGIWDFNLPFGLFWHPVRRPLLRSKDWRAPSWSWAAWDGEIMFENFFPEKQSTIRLVHMTEDSEQRGALQIKGQIHPCYVSLDLRPQPTPGRADRKLKAIPITPPEYAFAEDEPQLLAHVASTDHDPYDLDGDTPAVSLLRLTEGRMLSAQDAGERNMCRFDGERGTETNFFFLRLACSSGMGFHHCRGLLLQQATGISGAYERVGVGWSTDSIWHTTPESVVTLI